MSDQQPDKVIDVPGVGSVAFPPSMTDAQINAAATKLYQGANPSKKQPPVASWVDTAVDWLPAAGAMIGGTAAGIGGTAFLGPGGIIAGAAGAGLGGAIGESAKQTIDAMRGRGALKTPSQALTAIGTEAATDAAGALVAGGAMKAAQPVLRAAGPSVAAAGRVVEQAGSGAGIKHLSGAGMLYELLQGDWKKAIGSMVIPPLVRGTGRAMQSAGGAMAQAGTKAASQATAPTIAQRLANIPIEGERAIVRELLAQIGTEKAAPAAAKAATDLADEVLLVRASVAKGMAPQTAIRIVASGDAEYADALGKAWTASVKSRGLPIPEAALKASGKVAPAVTELMDSPTFQALAKANQARTP